ncbi:hypothetical protein NG895_10400 [Aeoliella sp. ICT_H6.2]|uniref:Uncharacterized protein n=1 Tax=Aeoliella straminimaris TaxID=2954799 RepID=A0A9X2FEE6_9BACT|nr:hypothetical protein [Aeoliella straminimaris]MCO6044316.1 hypothetical protein [Aeoliella straminimaris]
MIRAHLEDILTREFHGDIPPDCLPLIDEVAGGLLLGVHAGLFYNVDVLECRTWIDVVLLYVDGAERIHDALPLSDQAKMGPPPTLTQMLDPETPRPPKSTQHAC